MHYTLYIDIRIQSLSTLYVDITTQSAHTPYMEMVTQSSHTLYTDVITHWWAKGETMTFTASGISSLDFGMVSCYC